MTSARIPKNRRTLAITAVAGVLAGAVAVLSPAHATQEAASCKPQHVKVFPGDGLTHVRYGEVDFEVTVCPKEDAAGWDTNATAATNNTGTSAGYLLKSASLKALAAGENNNNRNATYMGSFVLKDCVPYVEWPCTRTYKVEVGFALLADKKSGKVRVVYGGPVESTMPRGLALYRTP